MKNAIFSLMRVRLFFVFGFLCVGMIKPATLEELRKQRFTVPSKKTSSAAPGAQSVQKKSTSVVQPQSPVQTKRTRVSSIPAREFRYSRAQDEQKIESALAREQQLLKQRQEQEQAEQLLRVTTPQLFENTFANMQPEIKQQFLTDFKQWQQEQGLSVQTQQTQGKARFAQQQRPAQPTQMQTQSEQPSQSQEDPKAQAKAKEELEKKFREVGIDPVALQNLKISDFVKFNNSLIALQRDKLGVVNNLINDIRAQCGPTWTDKLAKAPSTVVTAAIGKVLFGKFASYLPSSATWTGWAVRSSLSGLASPAFQITTGVPFPIEGVALTSGLAGAQSYIKSILPTALGHSTLGVAWSKGQGVVNDLVEGNIDGAAQKMMSGINRENLKSIGIDLAWNTATSVGLSTGAAYLTSLTQPWLLGAAAGSYLLNWGYEKYKQRYTPPCLNLGPNFGQAAPPQRK